jgi:hypothetical protein
LGSHPHGTAIVDSTRQVGTGHRIASQSAGLVVRVTLGQGVVVLVCMVVRVGKVTTLVMTPVGVVAVVRRVVGVVEVRRRVVVVVGHDCAPVRNSMAHPW